VSDSKTVVEHVGDDVTSDGDTLSENDLPPVVKNSRGKWSESEVSILPCHCLQINYLPMVYYKSCSLDEFT